ncbi:hypothetical protein V2J09_009813 [Rumex salicifolius]
MRSNLLASHTWDKRSGMEGILCNDDLKWWNKKAFEGLLWTGDKRHFIVEATLEYRSAAARSINQDDKRRKVVELINWSKPPHNWVKIKSNGTLVDGSKATAGGVIRDASGQWLIGFTHNLGCSVPKAELWGILDGLNLAWDKGYPRSYLSRFILSPPQYEKTTLWLALLLANSLVDSMAALALHVPIGLNFFNYIPPTCIEALNKDRLRITMPRLIPV